MSESWERYAVVAACITLLVVATIAAAPGVRIATGTSMHPTISGPAVVVCDPGVAPGDIEEGDVVAAPTYDAVELNRTPYPDKRIARQGHPPRDGPTVIHRVVETEVGSTDAFLRLRGDNNLGQYEVTRRDAVICRYDWHVSLNPAAYL
ncbi:S24/S26 family peptidase [Halostella salina]|uniref:hypothetical protein n=1 Tax=Halostella salina TaxID=1547897 RepID=UPI000EF847E4|nr:hypothetical protein [Halostella salina]